MSHPAETLNQLDGKYRVLAQLGQGGTADVSLAVARGPSGFSKLVVLKSMKSALRTEPEFASMFMNEARLAARLNHPNIVQTNEVFEFAGLPVIVMEYLEGQPLSNVLARARDSENDIFPLSMHLRVISDTLAGLHYSHELKDFDGTSLEVVHRDISPHNVFLTFDGQVKLLDFGIAKLSGSHVETAAGVIKGKLRYMPAEQITGEGVDRRADIFAVGVMLWEAATGHKMWHGMGEAMIMNHILNDEITSPREVNSDVDPELEKIILKALAADAGDRFQTAVEMQIAVDEYMLSLGSNIRQRDIGKVVATLFADARENTRKVIEDQLSKVSKLTDQEYAGLQPVELTNFATMSGFSGTGLREVAEAGPPKRSISMILLGIGVLFTWAIVAWLLLRPAEQPAPNVAAATPEATEEAPHEVRLRVTAFPATALIHLDGEVMPSNPFSRSLPIDSKKTHIIEATADGYTPVTREIRFDQDQEIVVTLAEQPHPDAEATDEGEEEPDADEGDSKTVAKVTRPRYRPRPKVVNATPAPAPRADCDPPYYVDERGVKKFKSQCL